jgi:hypothetical protein
MAFLGFQLPSAVASSLTLSFTYLIGALHSRRMGYAAILFLLLTFTFTTEARTISLDQFITAITTLCFYIIYSAEKLQRKNRILWIFPLLILGFALRGPIGLIIPASVICIFYFFSKEYRRLLAVGLIALILLILCSLLLLWMAYKAGGAPFLQEVLSMEILSRLPREANTPPFYFYFIESVGAYAITYPLALLILGGLAFNSRQIFDKKLCLKLAGWIFIILIGLSIPGSKKIRYILPITPALALICAYLFSSENIGAYFLLLKKGLLGFCFILSLLLISAALWIHWRQPALHFYYGAAVATFSLLLCSMIALRKYHLALLGLTSLAFFSFIILILEPINISIDGTQDFIIKINQLRNHVDVPLIFYEEGRDGFAIKYLANAPQEEKIVFIGKEEDLLKLKTAALIITRPNNYQHLIEKSHFKEIQEGKIGHQPIVIFQMIEK